MSFKESFISKSPLRQNGDGKQVTPPPKQPSYSQMQKEYNKARWSIYKKDLDAYIKKKDAENYVKFKQSRYPQSGAIEMTSGPETFFAAPSAKAGSFVLKKGMDLIKSKAAKAAKELGKDIGSTYAEAYLGL